MSRQLISWFSRMQSFLFFYDEYLDNTVMFQQHISKITETAVQLIRIRADLSPARMIYVDTDYLI